MTLIRRTARRIFIASAALLTLFSITLLLFLLPPLVHLFLDLTDAAERLSVTNAVAHGISNALVRDLLLGGTFEVTLNGALLLSASERSHLADVSGIFRLLIGVGAFALILLVWLYMSMRNVFLQGLHDGALMLGASALIVGGAFALSFDATFTLFHELLFPAGTWTFNPATDRLVQLYPISFWVLVAMSFCAVLVCAALVAFLVSRRRP